MEEGLGVYLGTTSLTAVSRTNSRGTLWRNGGRREAGHTDSGRQEGTRTSGGKVGYREMVKTEGMSLERDLD